MKAKEFLIKYQDALTEIKRLKGVLEEIENLAEAKGIDPSREKVQHFGGTSDIVGIVAAKAADLERNILSYQLQALGLLGQVEDVIKEVDDPKEKMLLSKRYIEGKAWETAADEMNISRRNIWRIRDKAYESVDKILRYVHISE